MAHVPTARVRELTATDAPALAEIDRADAAGTTRPHPRTTPADHADRARTCAWAWAEQEPTTAEAEAPAEARTEAKLAADAEHAADADTHTHTDRPLAYLLASERDGEAVVDHVAVHPDHTRRGLGAVLLARASRWAAERGLPALTLTTPGDAPPWHAPYFARLGFRETHATPDGTRHLRRPVPTPTGPDGRPLSPAAVDALWWLAEEGVVPIGPLADRLWTDGRTPDGTHASNDVAHAHAHMLFADDRLTVPGRMRLALGLLDLLDDYWVTCEIGFALADLADAAPTDLLWAGYRRRLEAERPAEPVEYSLWVDWFENHRTVEQSYTGVLGRDAHLLAPGMSEALTRRARRVLEVSGPVPWPLKAPALHAAARVPELRMSVFHALRAGYHDVYGHLEPRPAHALLTALRIPADTPHRAALTRVLARGLANHRDDPTAWPRTPETPPTPRDATVTDGEIEPVGG
ncbi:GNAT family N-acetyltransferase (plasmid) [Streptomyces sp. BI20]|uniref:GNAT family N-acetyltransferase n=1 Tax=Streptomyces sp. BI20 TaxID=3403460 RepID=UPI003C7661A1